MTRPARDASHKEAIHGALSSDFARGGAVDPQPLQVPHSLLLAVHLSQTAVAGLFCWICLGVYQGSLSPELQRWWLTCLVLLATVWMGALPLFAALWRFAPPIERRLPFWAAYWLGLLALPIVAVVVGSVRRLTQGRARRHRTEASLRL